MDSNLTKALSPGLSIITLTDGPIMTRFVDAIASAFENTPLTRSFSAEMDNQTLGHHTSNIDKACILRYVEAGIRASAKDGGILVEAGEMSAVAVWEIHRQFQHGQDAGESAATIGPLRRDFLKKVKRAKEKHVGTTPQDLGSVSSLRPHFHLEFLGRNPDLPRKDGAVSALVRPFLEQAQKDGVPVWLEATDLNAVSIYEHYGFNVVEEIVIGAGGDSGMDLQEVGNFEHCVWGMVWKPGF